MSTTPESAKPNRMPCLLIAGAAGCLLLCALLVVGGAAAYIFFNAQPGTVSPPGSSKLPSVATPNLRTLQGKAPSSPFNTRATGR